MQIELKKLSVYTLTDVMEKETEKTANRIVTLPRTFEIISKIEQKFPVDSITLTDGTKIWNLIRVILYFYVQKKNVNQTTTYLSLGTIYSLLKEGFFPLKFGNKIEICGFSGTESRRNRNGKFYDIYMDPLYDILSDRFWVFEWPTSNAYRRDYKKKVYSTNYVPMHIPLLSKTFFQILLYNLFKKQKAHIQGEQTIQDILSYFCEETTLQKEKVRTEVYDAIEFFYYLKHFLINLLKRIHPNAVFIRCGYGRMHMALSQACKELNITSIELQHGIITNHHIGYIKETKSNNRDCVPNYLLTYGEAFSKIVKKSTLFGHNKIISIGFPYMGEVINSDSRIDDRTKEFCSRFSKKILVTSQWDIADEINDFIFEVAQKLDNNIGLIMKPHPLDWRDYSKLQEVKNLLFVNKYDDLYEIMKFIDIHSTVSSTSGLEALTFGKPNIFIDICGRSSIKENIEILDDVVSFLVNSPNQFIEKTNYILLNYTSISNKAIQVSDKFFKKNAKKNLTDFLKTLGIS